MFKDDRYITAISENIKEQMKQQMKDDPDKYIGSVTKKSSHSNESRPTKFYITENHKLVISFDDYEVAPGYMGAVEFEIPTKAISNLLIGDRYIR
ncbi:RsiV family protein [Bacillus licheniformis]|nr:RsiV family protein [Bacillus licheniformis]